MKYRQTQMIPAFRNSPRFLKKHPLIQLFFYVFLGSTLSENIDEQLNTKSHKRVPKPKLEYKNFAIYYICANFDFKFFSKLELSKMYFDRKSSLRSESLRSKVMIAREKKSID